MKWIDKNRSNQPASLKKHVRQPHHNYENYKEKDELRAALLKEQGFICCYCMRRIQEATEDKMKIEHFKAYSIYNGTADKPDLTLDFTNLLAVCKGNKGALKHLQHCDESKKDTVISLNPMSKTMMSKIRFNSVGNIFIPQEEDLDGALNKDLIILNLKIFDAERKKIWETLDQLMRKEFGTNKPTKSFINQKLKDLTTLIQGKYEPMCQVYVYYFKKKLKHAV
jgi:uncharacterized protein (TIGR02646 family)